MKYGKQEVNETLFLVLNVGGLDLNLDKIQLKKQGGCKIMMSNLYRNKIEV